MSDRCSDQQNLFFCNLHHYCRNNL